MRGFLIAVLIFVAWSPAAAGELQDANKAVARSFFEQVLDQGRLDHYADTHAADFVVHSAQGDFPLAADMAAAAEERKALPDMRLAINRMIAEDDLVAVHWTVTGTNTGDGMGFKATGAKIKLSGITIFRVRAGKISEEWGVYDLLTGYRQAGLVQMPPS